MTTTLSAGIRDRTPVPWAARSVAAQWRQLAASGTPVGAMDSALLDGLPEPARRWLSAAIPVGAPLWDRVELIGQGHIRLGSWRPFTARQLLAVPDGFIWAATARVAGMPVVGFDRFSSGTGQMRWRLLGLIPVMSGSGPDITRSAAGRFAAEAIALLPTTFRQATWTGAADPDTAVATWRVGGEQQAVQVRVDPGGDVQQVVIDRWGNPDGGPYARHPFVVTVEEERRFDGIRMISNSARGGGPTAAIRRTANFSAPKLRPSASVRARVGRANPR